MSMQVSTMDAKTHTTVNLLGALLLPLLLMVCFIVPATAMPVVLPWSDNFSSEIISSTVGMVFVIRQFRWWATLIALVYLPGMFALLVYFALIFNGVVFGNWL
jgi:hypothetical protein